MPEFGDSEFENQMSIDTTFLQTKSAELHAKLIQSRDALCNGHEARGALLLEECIEEMSELTANIEKL